MIPKSLSLQPHYEAASAWWEHVPLAHWLIETLKPAIFVELGSHFGVSFFSFCEASEKYSPSSFLYAIDSWEGDPQAGIYGNNVFEAVSQYHSEHHKHHSRLIRSSFTAAADHFSDASIDLLHIDGWHTYDAVSQDFQTWLPKMKHGGTILFHDWNVREGDFGVWKFWDELQRDTRFQCCSMANGHGLGIATLAENTPNWHQELQFLRPALAAKGALLDRCNHLHEKLTTMQQHAHNLEQQFDQLTAQYKSLEAERDKLVQLWNRSLSQRCKRIIFTALGR